MASSKHDLLQGTLDLLILKILSVDQLHGWDISKRIQVLSKDALVVRQGSLYPALHRLEQKAWIEAEWGVSEAGRSAKFYRLTDLGRQHMEKETRRWEGFVESVSLILKIDKAMQ